MRALVRTLGSLLIVFGAVLWIANRASVKAPPPPTPVAVAPVAPAPAKRAHSRGGTTPAPATPDPSPVKAAPLSTVKMVTVMPPKRHDFDVTINGQDGWFDTGIPVTADLQIVITDFGREPGQSIPYIHYLQGRIGDTIIYPTRDLEAIGPFADTYASSTSPVPGSDLTQRIPLPESAKLTLKMRIFPAGSIGSVRCRIKVLIYGKDLDHPNDLTDAQQRELAELRKLELK